MISLMANPVMHEFLKYYYAEMDTWNKVLEHHKNESVNLCEKLTFLIEQQSSLRKAGTGFMDQLMVQQQMTEHLKGLIKAQQLQFDHLMELSIDSPWHSFNEDQDLLRTKMLAAERKFIRTQYETAFFLFPTLRNVLLATRLETAIKSGGK